MFDDLWKTSRSLDEQRDEFSRRRFLAMPLAGAIAWTLVGLAGVFATPVQVAWTLFIATGSIAYLGMLLSRFTGENFLDKTRPKNTFDTMFFLTVGMSLLVYAIAIPFFLRDYTSLPLSVGILTGLMWIPLSWIIRHWIGMAHAVCRTLLVLAAWYLFPTLRFVVIPALIVAIYVFTMLVLESRWRGLQQPSRAVD
ncbi:MAG: hypothetical protein ABI300_07695 [Rhodanobacter sp.]